MSKNWYILFFVWSLFFGASRTTYAQSATEVFISEYVEGSSNNKAIELYNGTNSPIDLTAGNYVIQMYFNGNAAVGTTVTLTGTIPANSVYVLAHGSASFITANGGTLVPNLTSSASFYNGDDAIVLRKGGASGTILDVIGQVGFDPGTQWGTDLTSTADNSIRRKTSICAGDIISSDVFDPTTEWDGFAQDVFGGLGAHTSSCSTSGASIVLTPTTLNFTTTVGLPSAIQSYMLTGSSLTSDVTVTSPATFGISTSFAGPFTGSLILDAANANAGTTLYVQYDPASSGNHSGNITHVSGSSSANLAVQGSSASASITPIYTIQGTTDVSPLEGSIVTTEGVVMADFQGTGQLNGFYIQDVTGDGNTSTSDGILVFNTTYPVNVGDLVRLTGEVDEFFNMTEIKTLSALTVLSTGNALPAAVNLTLPVAAISDLEKNEGMLVSFPQTLTATEVFTLGRFGEVSLSANGRLINPTNFIDPNDSPSSGTSSSGTSNVAAVTAQQDLNNRSRILLDDASSVQNPAVVPYLNPVDTTLRIGSTVANVTGVLEYAFSKYRIHPTVAPSFNYASRPTVPTVGAANVKVACFNVLNYFNGDGMGGGFPTARGAHTLVEFNRQRAKIIAAISQLNADVIGLMEIENDGSSSTSAIADLVNGLNDATASGTYAYVIDPTPANGGVGTDAIKVAMIYKPGVVSPSGLSIADNNAVHNRPPLAQTFTLNTNSEKFTVVVNHFKSKSASGASGADVDQLDGQGAYNNARKLQASALLTFISGLQTSTGDQDIITVGDYNAYGQEDPIDILLAGGLVNLLPNSYSYVFDGQTGSLDHALVSSSLASTVTGAEKWHLNSDEPIFKDYNQEFNPAYAYSAGPFRSSDHDPLLVGFNLLPAVTSFKLQLLHSSDGEGASQNMANYAAVLEKLEAEYPNTIRISSGDNWIPGPFFNASGDRIPVDPTLRSVYNSHFGAGTSNSLRASIGRIDVSVLNLLKFDAATFGNHEFDAGTNVVGEIVGYELSGTDKRWMGTQFPYLSANLDFSGDVALSPLFTNSILSSSAYLLRPDTLKATTPRRKIAPATIITVNGEQIGVVGATTQILESISSTGGVKVKGSKTNNMAELATYLQPYIDQLIAQGINKIIVSAHLQQIAFEKQLIGLLHGVDIVIAGGSSTLMADGNDGLRVGDVSTETYPLITQNADGEPALLVNANDYWKYVGRLVVDFQSNGVIDLSSLDSTVNGVYATTDDMVINMHGNLANAFAPGTKANLVKTLVDVVNNVVAAKDGHILGKTSVYLNGRRTDVRTQETNLGNISNDANIAIAKQTDPSVIVGLKNGGGIRTSIGEVRVNGATNIYEELPPQANPTIGKMEGDISQLDIENSLRFNNSLSLVTVTAAQLLQVVNHGVSATVPGATPGQFPQIGGMKFSFDPTMPAGSRVRNLVITDSTGKILDVVAKNGVIVGNPTRAIRMVTLSFLLTGGDGYPFPSFITANPTFANRVDLVTVGAPKTGLATFTDNGSEQDAFAEYIATRYATTPYNKLDEAIAMDDRIQNLAVKADSVLGTAPVVSNFSKSTNEDVTLVFSLADFSTNFNDADGDKMAFFTLTKEPTKGILIFNDLSIQLGDAFPASEFGSLRYVPFADINGKDTIGWNGADLTGYAVNSANVFVDIVSVNDLPTTKVTSPVNNANFQAGNTIVIKADAADKDGTVKKVLFYANLTLLGEDSRAPYEFAFTNVPSGSYNLYTKVIDNLNATVTSSTVKVNVQGCSGSGTITREMFLNIPGSSIANLTSNSRYPNSPNVVFTRNNFEGSSNYSDNYGSRMLGFICAPETGNYTFFIAADDKAELWLSTDANPVNKQLIASVPFAVNPRAYLKYPSQKSNPISLVKGVRYFVMALHKEATSNDHISVAWTLPSNIYQNPIPGSVLSPWTGGSVARDGEIEGNIVDAFDEINVSPVPAQDHINVTFFAENSESAEVSLTDALSNELIRKNVSASRGSNTVEMKLDGLPSGIYLVHVITPQGRKTQKIVIAGR